MLQNQTDAATRTLCLSCFQIRDLIHSRRGEAQPWTYFQVTAIGTGTWISHIHRILQASVGSSVLSQVLYLFHRTLRLQELGLEIQVKLFMSLSWYLHLRAVQSALPYLLSSQTIRENQRTVACFCQECPLLKLHTFIGKQGPKVLGSLLAVPLTTFSTL